MQYEYCEQSIFDDENFLPRINDLGKQGWKLVERTRANFYWRCLFEREVQALPMARTRSAYDAYWEEDHGPG